MTHGFVLAGIGFHLGAIQSHMPKAHHAGLLAQPQDLNKQTFEGIQIAAPELGDPAVVLLMVPVSTRKARSS